VRYNLESAGQATRLGEVQVRVTAPTLQRPARGYGNRGPRRPALDSTIVACVRA
jgi:hypothetical protein